MIKTCIIIAGPTASGKTSIAVKLAKHFSTSIISADSRQCYRELNIGVAKPSPEELSAALHYFINSHSINDNLSAADFEVYALDAIREIFKKNDIAVLVGGTGLYIKAFCEGMDDIPEIKKEIRKHVIDSYHTKGIEWLQKELKAQDSAYAIQGEMLNPQRMLRALETKLSTGISITEFQSGEKKKRDFDMIKIGLQLPRDILYERINNRVDMMVSQGLVAEVESLIPFRKLNALQTVGYRELFEYFDGKISLEGATDLIKQNTRHYAKRQMTWFNKDEEMNWCAPELNEVIAVIGR